MINSILGKRRRINDMSAILLIFSKDNCPYCEKIINFCNKENVKFILVKLNKESNNFIIQPNQYLSEIQLSDYQSLVKYLKENSNNHNTFPWIFDWKSNDFLGGWTKFNKEYSMGNLEKYGLIPDF